MIARKQLTVNDCIWLHSLYTNCLNVCVWVCECECICYNTWFKVPSSALKFTCHIIGWWLLSNYRECSSARRTSAAVEQTPWFAYHNETVCTLDFSKLAISTDQIDIYIAVNRSLSVWRTCNMPYGPYVNQSKWHFINLVPATKKLHKLYRGFRYSPVTYETWKAHGHVHAWVPVCD